MRANIGHYAICPHGSIPSLRDERSRLRGAVRQAHHAAYLNSDDVYG